MVRKSINSDKQIFWFNTLCAISKISDINLDLSISGNHGTKKAIDFLV
jgi:hypothetical protein